MMLSSLETSAPSAETIPAWHRLAARIDGLPALPLITTRLLEALDDPHTTAADLATLISSDPALATRLLKMANSAYYGFPRRIGTVNLAVVVLGFETVRDLSLAVLITDCFFRSDDPLPFDLEAFWKHSLAAAVGGRMIFRLCGVANPGEGFIAGLVHDIGKLLQARYFPKEYSILLQRVGSEGLPLLEAEQENFQATHPEIGAWLLDEWNLPPWLVQAVRDHHGSPGEITSQRLAQAVGFTDLLVRRAHYDSGCPGVQTLITPEMIENLKLKKDIYGTPDYGNYLEKLRRELLRSEDLLDTIRQGSAQAKR